MCAHHVGRTSMSTTARWWDFHSQFFPSRYACLLTVSKNILISLLSLVSHAGASRRVEWGAASLSFVRWNAINVKIRFHSFSIVRSGDSWEIYHRVEWRMVVSFWFFRWRLIGIHLLTLNNIEHPIIIFQLHNDPSFQSWLFFFSSISRTGLAAVIDDLKSGRVTLRRRQQQFPRAPVSPKPTTDFSQIYNLLEKNKTQNRQSIKMMENELSKAFERFNLKFWLSFCSYV